VDQGRGEAMAPQGSEEFMPVDVDENTEIESLIQQPAVKSQHGRWTRKALVLLAVVACVAALAVYGTTGVRDGSQSTSVVQLVENDECTDLQGIEARCRYVQWDYSISKCNKHVDLTCVPTRARTNGKTCKEWCAQDNKGYICLRAQDNDGNCKGHKSHDRQSTENNGCDQSWGDQICQCGKKLCQDAHSCATHNVGRYGCNAEEKERCPKACKVCS